MKQFELRLAEHHARNARHLKNLRSFADNQSRFMRLLPDEQALILTQIDHMAALDEVLVKRMHLHKIPV